MTLSIGLFLPGERFASLAWKRWLHEDLSSRPKKVAQARFGPPLHRA